MAVDKRLSDLPAEILISIFKHLEIEEILSFRQLSKMWRDLVDEEDVSRFILHNTAFTFRRRSPIDQPEMERLDKYGGYSECMKRLVSRLRGLHSNGPSLIYSLAHPRSHQFCYGCGMIAVENQRGESIQLRAAESGVLLHTIVLSDVVDSFQTPFLISNLRIRNSILSVILSEVQNPSPTNGNHTRQMVVIFFRVTENSSLPVLRVPLRRYNSYNHSPVLDCLCDFNDQFAVILSPSTTSVWCLKTGQLIMGDISIRSVIGVHVEEQS